MALISILGSDPALGGVQEQILSQIWNQHLWFSMWACASLLVENCSRIAIQHWEVCKSKSDPRFGISTFGIVCEHVHHYFWKLLQDYHWYLPIIFFDIWATFVCPANFGLFLHLSNIGLPRKFGAFFFTFERHLFAQQFFFDIWATFVCPAIFFCGAEFLNLTFEIH